MKESFFLPYLFFRQKRGKEKGNFSSFSCSKYVISGTVRVGSNSLPSSKERTNAPVLAEERAHIYKWQQQNIL